MGGSSWPVCLGVLVLGLRARRTPRIAQLAFLIVVGFLLVNKVYSPQYVLWLLPLAVLARPRWRDLLIWQAGEVALLRRGLDLPRRLHGLGDRRRPDPAYDLARSWSGWPRELYLAAVVVRDMLPPVAATR